MGPELIAAVIGPLLGGTISLILWVGRRNASLISDGFKEVHTGMDRVERKVDDLKDDVNKNYVRNNVLEKHITMEEDWHTQVADQVQQMRVEMREDREISRQSDEKLRNDIGEIKDMQWRLRLDIENKKTQDANNFEI
jgi:hypothetical protein